MASFCSRHSNTLPIAAAHEGSVHAGIPHRLLLVGVVLGGGILVGSLYMA